MFGFGGAVFSCRQILYQTLTRSHTHTHTHRLIFMFLSFFHCYSLDFWTTKCTKCPDALDKLDEMARDPKYENVQFVSICCDQLDGARNIIEKEDDLRWQNVNHYFMSQADKEHAKKELGFQSVPFYVVLDQDGTITQKGNSKAIDFDDVPGVVVDVHQPEPVAAAAAMEQCISNSQFEEEKKQDDDDDEHNDDDDDFAMDFELDFAQHQQFKEPPVVSRIFSLEDDF